jgi:hypothetical protein
VRLQSKYQALETRKDGIKFTNRAIKQAAERLQALSRQYDDMQHTLVEQVCARARLGLDRESRHVWSRVDSPGRCRGREFRGPSVCLQPLGIAFMPTGVAIACNDLPRRSCLLMEGWRRCAKPQRRRLGVAQVVNVAHSFVEVWEGVAGVLAEMDVLLGFAELSVNAPTPYVRPTMLPSDDGEVVLIGAPHHQHTGTHCSKDPACGCQARIKCPIWHAK